MGTCADRGSCYCRLTPALNFSDHWRVLVVSFFSPVPLFKGCVWLCSWKRKRTKRTQKKKRISQVGHMPWDWNHVGEFRPELHWLLHSFCSLPRGAALLYWRRGGPENVGEREFNLSNTWSPGLLPHWGKLKLKKKRLKLRNVILKVQRFLNV